MTNNMKKITQEELNKILELHQKWLNDDPDGYPADLSDTDLSGVDLNGADLRYACLFRANFSNANLFRVSLRHARVVNTNLSGADLRRSDLRYAYLIDTDLSNADLSNADLNYTDLSKANLSNANLRGSNFFYANLTDTKLDNIKSDETTLFLGIQCPEEGSFIGYEKADGKIVVLKIKKDAKRSSATSRNCRCSKAKVLRIEDLNGNILNIKSVKSDYYEDFIYNVGKTLEVKNFDENRWNEYSTGIHFFMTKQEAINY